MRISGIDDIVPETGDIINEAHHEWLERQPPEYMELRQGLINDPRSRKLALIIEHWRVALSEDECNENLQWLEEIIDNVIDKRKADQQ